MRAGIVHHMLLMKFMNREFIRFVIIGGINTGSTYFIYLLLLNFLNYSISYTVSYLFGIVISYFLNTYVVFKEKISLKKFIKFPIVYIVQYLINIIMIYIFVENFEFSNKVVPLLTIIITIPVTYTISRLIVRGK